MVVSYGEWVGSTHPMTVILWVVLGLQRQCGCWYSVYGGLWMVLRLSDSNMWLSVLGLRWIVDGTWTMREMCGTRATTEYRAWYISYDSGLLLVLRL